MPWGYRKKSISYRGGTSAWTTAGETASLKNACAQYGLTVEQVHAADPPIPCQWRSCMGNSYPVVQLSDMARLKRRIEAQAKEDEKRALIEELGEEGYKAKFEADAAARRRKEASEKLVPSLEVAVAASGSGIADSLEGMTLSKTAAKTEWYVKPDEMPAPIDDSKKQKKYRLADVIRVAHEKTKEQSGSGGHIRTRVKGTDREKLYARYLHDIYEVRCKEVGDESVIKAARGVVRGKISKAVEVKAAAITKAQNELKAEQSRLEAFDNLMMDGNNRKRPTAAGVAKEAARGLSIIDENRETGSKKPAAKKQKVTKE
ncbi:hypothetical protein ACHAWF_003613 [Thalassiosira exigua]